MVRESQRDASIRALITGRDHVSLTRLPQRVAKPISTSADASRRRPVAAAASASASATSASPVGKLLAFVKAQFLPVGLMTAMAFGALYPQPGAAAAANGLQKLSTTGIFVVSGLLLKAGDAKRAVKEWPAVAYGVAAILALTPLIGGLGALSVPGLSRELAIGLAVFAAMPTSLSSCVTLTHAVGANSALALLLVVTTNTLGIFSMPFVLCRLLCTSTGVAIEPRPLLLALVQNILVPLAAGALVRAVARPVAAWVDANKRLMQYVSTGLLCLVPWMQISSTMLAKPDVTMGSLATAIALGTATHVVFVAVNMAACRALSLGGTGPDAKLIRRPVVFCASQKTLPVAVTTLNTLSTQMGFLAGVAVIPCVFSHFGQIVIDSFLASHWMAEDRREREALGGAAAG